MIVAAVRRTIEQRGLIERGMRVLAACSGGPDSAAMLVALAQLEVPLGFELLAAGVDHGLRPDSARDVAIAAGQAAALGVPFQVLSVQVAAGASLQAAARKARYAALIKAAAQLGAQRIAVGHTRDDQAETVLMRLLRGAGLAGLAAIEPLRDDGVVRPLIDCGREEVQAFAAARCAEIASDPANQDPRFERVRVRRTLLPALRVEDAALIEHLCDVADDARDALVVLQAQARRVLERCRQGAESIAVSGLVAEPSALRRTALRLWVAELTGCALGRAHLTQLEHALLHGGEVWLPGGYAACRNDDVLRLRRALRRSDSEPAP